MATLEKETPAATASIDNFDCKPGNIRSFAQSAVPILSTVMSAEDAKATAWSIAKDLQAEKPEFTTEEAREMLRSKMAAGITPKPAAGRKDATAAKEKAPAKARTSTPRNNAPATPREKPTLSGDALTMAQDEKQTKNDRIRKLLALGHEVSPIANAMGLTYQRVKNVKKAIDKKADADAKPE